VFGARLESVDHRRRGRPRTTIGLATTTTRWGRPADLLGVSLTVEDPVNRMLDDAFPRTTALTAFYGWRINSAVVCRRESPGRRIVIIRSTASPPCSPCGSSSEAGNNELPHTV